MKKRKTVIKIVIISVLILLSASSFVIAYFIQKNRLSYQSQACGGRRPPKQQSNLTIETGTPENGILPSDILPSGMPPSGQNTVESCLPVSCATLEDAKKTGRNTYQWLYEKKINDVKDSAFYSDSSCTVTIADIWSICEQDKAAYYTLPTDMTYQTEITGTVITIDGQPIDCNNNLCIPK